MESGYKIIWTDFALEELRNIIQFLEENWTKKEIKNFSRKLNHNINLISNNPEIFPKSPKNKLVRRAVKTKHNTLYYWIKSDFVEILSLFSNQQNPSKQKL